MSTGRVIRATMAASTFVAALWAGNKWSRRDEICKMPKPLPEMEGQTNDELLADTVSRYARMAPVYDELLDKVEAKYRGFELRRDLIQSADGHVLEIGVGTARNIPFYDNTKVKSITFVDSTYPMLNAALIKNYDIYSHHNIEGLLVSANKQYTFKSLPVLHPKDLHDITYLTPPETPTETQAVIKHTFRPQILLPATLSADLKGYITSLSTSFAQSDPTANPEQYIQHYLNPLLIHTIGERFPPHIADLFISPPQSTNDPSTAAPYDIQNVNNITIQIDDEIDDNHSNQSSVGNRIIDGKQDRWNRPKESWTEEEIAQRREEQAKIGSKWKEFTNIKNIIPTAFIHLDCHDLELFPEDSYDTVVDTFGLCSFHHPVDVLTKMQKICKPGGKILLLEHGLGTGWLINRVIKRTNDQHKKHWGCDRAKDIVQILKDAGFDCAAVKREHSGSTIIFKGHPQKSTTELNNYYMVQSVEVEKDSEKL